MAAADEAEKHHRQRAHVPSPLEGVAYDAESGEYELFRFVASATDDRVGGVALSAEGLQGGDLANYRDSLTQDDLYTLLAFTRRVTVRALRGDTEPLPAAWAALGIVHVQRVDWRDAAVAASLLAYGSARAGADLGALTMSASSLADPQMAKVLRDYAASAEDGVSVGGYREVQTRDGAALVQDFGEPYSPAVDLLAIAASVAELIERDRYRVTDITTGTAIAPVWLPAADRAAVQATVGRVRGCVSVSAAPLGEATSAFPDQTLLAFVAECASVRDATLLAEAARQPDSSDIAEIAVSSERVCLIVVGRSTVIGIEPIESTESLGRFRGPLTAALLGG